MWENFLAASKILYPIVAGLIGLFAGIYATKIKAKKDSSEADIQFRKQLIDQYNHIVLRVENLEAELQQKSEIILQQKNKLYRLENKLSEEFNHISVMQAYFAHMPRPAWLKAPDGIMYYINDAFQEQFGISKIQYEGQTDSNIWGIDIARTLREKDKLVLSNKKGLVTDIYLPSSPGSILFDHYEVALFPVMHKGQLIGVGGCVCRKLTNNEEEHGT